MRGKSPIWILVLMILGAQAPAVDVGFIHIKGAIGPATASYIDRAIRISSEKNHACLMIQLDTPGGLLDSTKDIVQSFYGSKVPVMVYVAPSGANAGSAGCFITLAADLAVMAPNTSIGAAHPVSIGMGGGSEKPDEVMSRKLENYAASYIESIAQKRGRNVEWARSAVIDSESVTAEKALELKVIDYIAADVTEALAKADGRKVREQALELKAARVINIPMIARERIFQMLWRPEVMLILMLAAIYGIIGELSNPGAVLPGVVGGIALILVLYLSAILPVNIAGLALIGLALLLFLADVFAPTHGVLTAGGIGSFFLGAVMLFDGAGPGFRLSLVYIIPATLVTAAFFIFVAGAGLRAQGLPIRAGKETMLGQRVAALSRINREGGQVFIEGENWRAVSDNAIEAGTIVEVTGIEGLTLRVRVAAAAAKATE
jgi:membrane-bound serine protease (ClpP class)